MSRTYRNPNTMLYYRPGMTLIQYENRERYYRPGAYRGYRYQETEFGVKDVIEYFKRFRDSNGTGTNYKTFRSMSNNYIRSDTKRKINHLQRDVESFDDMVFFTKREGKKFYWCVF